MKYERPGSPPQLTATAHQGQLTQGSPRYVWDILVEEILDLPNVERGKSPGLPKGSIAVFLTDRTLARRPETSLSRGGRLEPVHIHGPADTSLHLCLPEPRAAEVVAAGWGTYQRTGDFLTELLVFAPRDIDEIDVILGLVEEALAFARS